MPFVLHLLELFEFLAACVINHFYATINAANIYGGVFVTEIFRMPEAWFLFPYLRSF
jgi:hypothetical protein